MGEGGTILGITAIIDINLDINAYNYFKDDTRFLHVRGALVVDVNQDITRHKSPISHGGECLKMYARGANRAADYFILLRGMEIGRRNIDDLVTALGWCIENGVNIISLSMGTTDYRDMHKLSPIIERVSQAGICIIAAADNDGLLTYPACLEQCIGVRVDSGQALGLSGFTYIASPHDGINVIIAPYMLDGVTFNSNSFATAYFAGLLVGSINVDDVYANDINKWLVKNSKLINPADLYRPVYIDTGAHANYENVVIIAAENLSKPCDTDFYNKVQELFLNGEHYCLAIVPDNNTAMWTDFSRHIHKCSCLCTYSKFIELLIRLCQPDVVIVDYEEFSTSCANADVVLLQSDSSAAAEDALVINIQYLSPKEVFDAITSYFNE